MAEVDASVRADSAVTAALDGASDGTGDVAVSDDLNEAGADAPQCECTAGQAECTLDGTAVRSCSNGCTWSVELCLAGCVDDACCEPCSADFARCQSTTVKEFCVDGCVAQRDCSTIACSDDYPHAPLPGCELWPWGDEEYIFCRCLICRTAKDCEGPQTLGVRCGDSGVSPACGCGGNADCADKTAGPKCLGGFCGCVDDDDCPGAETCVDTHVYAPVGRHRVCSGNLLWPAE